MNEILIVDDEKDIRELVSEILIDEGYSTRLASNSAECLTQVANNPPSLLILDIWLKDSNMDGIDILKKVKIDYPNVPVVIISGHGNIEIAVSAIKQGAYDFIEKPFKVQKFMKKIDFILAKISGSLDITHTIGPFVFFPEKRVMVVNNKTKIELTEKEAGILKCLLGTDEEIVDRDTILKQVWDYNPSVTTHTLETHIYRLRQKLEIDKSIPRLIISKGGGFKINQI